MSWRQRSLLQSESRHRDSCEFEHPSVSRGPRRSQRLPTSRLGAQRRFWRYDSCDPAHTRPPGAPCLAHSPADGGTRDRAMSKCADVVMCRKQDWSRRRRVDSRTTHASIRLLVSTPKECTIRDEMHMELLWCKMRTVRVLQTGGPRGRLQQPQRSGVGVRLRWKWRLLPRLRPGHGVPSPSCSPDAVFGVRWWLWRKMFWCECCRAFTCYGCWISGALAASETSPPTLR